MSAERIIAAAREAGLWIATAESCTGGLLAGALTEVAGASAVFDRGVITYSNRSKTELLGVRPETLAAVGAVSEEVAREMAEGARARAGADLAVSVTGIAGPGGSEFKPEGRVCFGLASRLGTQAITRDFGPLGRSLVRAESVQLALGLVEAEIARLTAG